MTRSTHMTASVMRELLRSGRRRRQAVLTEILEGGIPQGSHTPREMVTLLREKLQARGDRGGCNLVKNLLLEPRNPLEPGRHRRPKREVMAVGTLLGMLLAALIWFNFLVAQRP